MAGRAKRNSVNPPILMRTLVCRSYTRISAAFSLASAVFCGVPHASVIINGGFEEPIAPLSWGGSLQSLPGWTVGGEINLIMAWYWLLAEGSQSIDLVSEDTSWGGLGSGPGTYIEQTFATTIGQSYSLTFEYGNNASYAWASANVMVWGSTVFINEDIMHSGSSFGDMLYTSYSKSFIADAPEATLRFTHKGSPEPYWGGIALDNVKVSVIIPEPSHLALHAGLALLGLVVLRKRG